MKRPPHYLRTNLTSATPQLLAYVDTETDQTPIDDTTLRHDFKFGWVAFESHWGSAKWSPLKWDRFDDVASFWDIVEGYTRPKTKLHIFAHNWIFDGPALKMFSILPRRGWGLKRAIMERPPFIASWRRDDRTMYCLDTLNWFRFSLAKLGERLGIPKLDFPGYDSTPEVWDTYCRQDVTILRETVRAWITFIIDNDLGSFAPTLASQSLKAFRHRFLKHKIFFDGNEPATALARESYHGGRVEAFHIGRVEGPIHCLDVNSMYPAVMEHGLFPTQLVSRTNRVILSDLPGWVRDFAVVAKVRLDIDEPYIAHFTGEKLVFPVGRIVATLTTPELEIALSRGDVHGCDEVVCYEKASVFSDFVSQLYNLRLESKAAGDDVAVWLLKIMMNSLYGKFGQRGRVWETVDTADPDDFSIESTILHPEGRLIQHRTFAGIMQEKMNDEETRESFPAIASHVTALARCQLWSLINQAGRDNVFYCDTDSLWVNNDGLANLSDEVDADRLGGLKLERSLPWAEIHGSKDYSFGEEWKCKGVRQKAEWISPNHVRQEMWPGFQGLLARKSLDNPLTCTIEKHLARVYDKGEVAEDGTVSPLRFSEW